MNKELASLIKNKIQSFPFIDRLAGLVQTVEDVQPVNEAGKMVINKFPVSYDVFGDDCTGREKDLVPDTKFKSVTYFEDFGSKIVATRGGVTEFNSQLRLISWLNRDRLVGDDYVEISAACINAIIGKICGKLENDGIFMQLSIKAFNIPPQNSDLFSKYTYDQTVRQYLRPPFEFFGIDLLCNYRVNPNCLTVINFTIDNNC